MSIARIRPLISTNWLRENILKVQTAKSGSLRVLETSWLPDSDKDINEYKEEYLSQHIPTAQYFDINKCSTSTQFMRRNVPDMNCFTDYAQTLGINDNTHVVAYDRFNSLSSVRTWWLFRLFGHRHVSVLDGGLRKWIKDGFEVTDDVPQFPKGNFTAAYNSMLIRDYENMCKNIESKKEQVVDARNVHSFRGEKELQPGVKKGHMKGAKNIPYRSLFNEDGTFKSEHEIKRLFDAAAIDMGKPVTSMCETGLTACGLAMAGYIVGKENIPVYAGSMHEWGQRAPEDLCISGKS